MPNPDVLLAPLTAREAVLSSRIEGTQASTAEVLEFAAGRPADSLARASEYREVLNYRTAMSIAIEMLDRLPLSLRVVREAHRSLLKGVRGEGKAPGEFRRTPNWIGPPGSTMETASYVPISAEHLPDALGRWEAYMHSEASDLLVQAANTHVEFEALHPFLDGNGRVGRMLIPLFFWQRDLISRPTFHISAYFEAHRSEYYERLLGVSRDDDWTGWCRFFLKAIRNQAEENTRISRDILRLYDEMKIRLVEVTRSKYSIILQDFIFRNPVFRNAGLAEQAGIPVPTAKRILAELRNQGILTEVLAARGRQSSICAFLPLLEIIRDRHDRS